MATTRSLEGSPIVPLGAVRGPDLAPSEPGLESRALFPSEEQAVLAAGTVVGGRFEIDRLLHRSGMSTVYRARIRGQRRPLVAIKQFAVGTLPPEEQEEALRWLAREAGLLSSLRHPRLPELLAAFSEGDNHYIVMPYLQGETMKELVERGGPLGEAEVLRWAAMLADVLAFLHGQDPPVIHRDLKPENILILSGRQLMLLDLGVARRLARGLPSTAIGTPGYAPPEQYQGLADERSDLYALGATLHFMLTGYDAEHEAPFRHPPLASLRPALDPALESIVERLLRLPPQERPFGALVVGNELAGVIDRPTRLYVRAMYDRALRYYLSTGTGLLALFAILAVVSADAALLWALLPLAVFAAGAAAYRPRHRSPSPQTAWGQAVLHAVQWRTSWMLTSAICTYALAFLTGRLVGGWLALLTCLITVLLLVQGRVAAERPSARPESLGQALAAARLPRLGP